MGNASNTSVFTSTLSEREDLIFGTLYLIFGVLSLSGNSLLLLVAHQKRSLLKPAELFIVNLAISDLSMTVTLFPLATSSFFAHRWLFGQAVCTLYAFCGLLFGLGSLGSLAALSAVCCLKVCYPAYGSRFSRGHAAGLLLALWLYALAFAGAPLARWGSYGPEPYGTACCLTWEASGRAATLYILALLICCYLLPCLLILASYALILWTVWASRRAVRQHTCPRRGARGPHGLLLRLSMAVCLGFLAAWTPYAVLALWALLGDTRQLPALAFVLSAVLAKSSTLYNPLVYLLLKPSFHELLAKDRAPLQALLALLCCGCRGTALQPLPAAGCRGCPGACSSCSEVFEGSSGCPRCHAPAQLPGPARGPGRAARQGRGAAGAQQDGAAGGAARTEPVRPGHCQRGTGGPALGHGQGPALSPALPSCVQQSTGTQTQTQHPLTPCPAGPDVPHPK